MSGACPSCGSDDLLEWEINGRVGMECRVCGHTWDPKPDDGSAK